VEVSRELYAPEDLSPGRFPRSHWIGGWVGPKTGQPKSVEHFSELKLADEQTRDIPVMFSFFALDAHENHFSEVCSYI
jgi:hypothetical protein